MPLNYRKIGDLIQLVDERNKELKVNKLLGLSISKQFIPSVANTVGTNMRNYKIIRKNQFACSIMQVRRDKKMPVALLKDFDEAIISQAYPVFEVKDEEEILPEYLMMWMSRSEFDRHACFLAVGGVRGSLEWKDFCNMELPIPSIEKQREIVQEYNTIVNRIKLNEQLNKKLEETAQALYKHWFVDFEFPNKNGQPYKSSAGKMVWNEELGKEIPDGWSQVYLHDIVEYNTDRIKIKELHKGNYVSTENMIANRGGIKIASSLPRAISVSKFNINQILISNIRPYFKKIWLSNFLGGCSNDILCFKPKKNYPPLFVYYLLEQDIFFDYIMQSAKGTKMPRGDKKWIMKYHFALPPKAVLKHFESIIHTINERMTLCKKSLIPLNLLGELILSKMSKPQTQKQVLTI